MKKVTKEYKWFDIGHETYRTYVFPGLQRVIIPKPKLLAISSSGGHRILDANDKSHYIPAGWLHLYWETNDKTAFRF